MRRVQHFLCASVVLVSSSALAQVEPALFSDLHWRLVGPFRGGWATCAEGVPDAPETFYFGAAAGGVWKSENAGRTWTPIFDDAPAASVGALAIAPSDPKVIYVGTGQIQARYDIASGRGVFRSDDAGKTWRPAGLEATRAIGRILIDPHDPNVVLVAALGHIYGPNKERGVFRTEDGGRTWRQVLFVDDNTGGADLAVDPENPRVVYASVWQARNYPWLSYFEPIAGPGSGVHKSTDGGRTWTRVTGSGWPSGPLGRIGLGAAHGGRVWALVDAPPPAADPEAPGEAGLYRSDDAGASWTRVNATRGLASSYMNRVTPDPRDRDAVYVTGQSIRRSEDGGKTLRFFKGAPGGDDYHFLWIDPHRPDRMVTAADQGAVVSVDGGRTWSSWYNQPTGQFYHVETDSQFPYWIYSGQQDSGTAATASRSDYAGLTFREWHPVGGEERGWDVPHPEDPRIVYGSGLGGTITRFDTRTGEVRTVSPISESSYGRRPVPGADRWAWVFPLAIGRKPPHPIYSGSQYLLRSNDGGQSWEKASPDLTGVEEGAVKASGCDGRVTVDNARPCGFGVVFTIALSPRDENEIWVGTDSGLVQLTRDGGRTWTNVTPPGVSAWSKIATIDVSALEPGVAYAAVDRHRLDDFSPHAYRTHDYGKTWQEIGAGLPATSFVTVVRADPMRRGLLYAGTDASAFVSFDDGGQWQPLRGGLPTCWVGDLQVHGNDLVAATQGRALWVLDDVSPLRQIAADPAGAATSSIRLFAPADAVRIRGNENRDTPLPPEEPLAHNPPPGAVIDYFLAKASASPVRLEILDDRGAVVRAFSSADPAEKLPARRYFTEAWVNPAAPPSAAPGHHRLVWDLRSTRPRAAEYDYSIAGVVGEDTPLQPRGPLVPPGRYTVRLTAGSAKHEQPLTVVPDPRVSVAPTVFAERLAFEREIVAAMSESSDALEQVRAARKRLADRQRTGASGGALAEWDRRARALEAGEGAGRGRRAGGGLAGITARLSAILTAVDAADAPPTAVQRDGAARARAELSRLLEEWHRLAAQEPRP